ncbi:MAG: hypothetical protein J6U54_13955 [Clostridiales bacterium]|nr:hypothetical protein [Clostridiales bacterium]
MAYYSFFYKYFFELSTEQPVFDPNTYNAFLKRRIQLSKERAKKVEEKTQNIKVKLTNTLREVELDFQENGVDASEEELLAELVRRVRG